jgi:type IX secretion system PorP/SprF family membrane protein
MKLKIYLLLLGCCFFVPEMKAQDPIFTQYFLVPQTLNPGFAGFLETTHIGIVHRTQWPALGFRIDTNYGFASTWFAEANSGVGVSFLNQRESQSGYTFSQVNVNYAYQVQLGDDWYFRPGLEFGRGWKNIGFQGLLLEDQINIQANVINPTSVDALFFNDGAIGFWDISAGLLFNTENAWIGLSAKHLNRPNISLTVNGNVPLETFFSVSAGYEFIVTDMIDVRFLPFDTRLMITGNYMHQGRFNRFDLGTSLSVGRFFLGTTLVTNPAKNSGNSHLLTSVNAFTGLQYTNFRFGISYDFNTSDIGRTGGVYELSLTYQFDSEAKRCFGCPDYQD